MQLNRKRFLPVLVFLLLLCAGTACMTVSAGAAQKKGLKKEDGKYYFYSKGKKVTNKLKKVSQKKGTYYFYFGKDGAAYQAKMIGEKNDEGKIVNVLYNVKLFRIGNKQYGFDCYGHRVEKGIYVDSKSKLYVFDKKGVYNKKKTQALRKREELARSSHGIPRSTDLYDRVIEVLGEPVKVVRNPGSCNGWNVGDPFTGEGGDAYTDVHVYYDYFEVELVYDEDTKEYALNEFYPIVVKN